VEENAKMVYISTAKFRVFIYCIYHKPYLLPLYVEYVKIYCSSDKLSKPQKPSHHFWQEGFFSIYFISPVRITPRQRW